MRRVQLIGEPAVLADSKDPIVVGPWYVLSAASVGIHESDSAEQKQQAPYPDRELAQLGIAVLVACPAEQPLGVLRPQSCGCSPQVQPDGLPQRGHREPVPPVGTSDGPKLAGAESRSHDPNAGLWLLSVVRALAAARRDQAGLWLSRCEHVLPLRVHERRECH